MWFYRLSDVTQLGKRLAVNPKGEERRLSQSCVGLAHRTPGMASLGRLVLLRRRPSHDPRGF